MLDTTTDKSRLFVAIHEAADHIERHPDRFEYFSIDFPHDLHLGPPGCGIGWIGFFLVGGDAEAQFREGGIVFPNAKGKLESMTGVHAETFYHTMDYLVGREWEGDAALCAKGMRMYAEQLMEVKA